MRRVAEIRDGRPVFADTVGVLTSWSDGVLIITRRDGQNAHISESVLVAGKPVPPAPVRRGPSAPAANPAELREAAVAGWPAGETEPLGNWLLRASGGFTRRANSVSAPDDPGLPLDEALRRTADWYAARGLPPLLQVEAGGALDEALAARGWTAEGQASVRTAALAPVADRPGAERVRLARTPGPDWLRRYHRADGAVAAAAERVLTGGASVWFASVASDAAGSGDGAATDGGYAAIGRCAVQGRWAVFGAVEVAPGHRRSGLATAVMAALARQALDEGAFGALLQVETGNTAAATLYDSLGFTTVGTYHYRRPPSDIAGTARG